MAIITSGSLGSLSYARFCRHHKDVDLGGDLGVLLEFAQICMGEVKSVHARGQWIGDAGAITLVLDHGDEVTSLVDVSSAAIRLSQSQPETRLRIEGSSGTLEWELRRLCTSRKGRREVRDTSDLSLAVIDPDKTQALLTRALQAAESGAPA